LLLLASLSPHSHCRSRLTSTLPPPISRVRNRSINSNSLEFSIWFWILFAPIRRFSLFPFFEFLNRFLLATIIPHIPPSPFLILSHRDRTVRFLLLPSSDDLRDLVRLLSQVSLLVLGCFLSHFLFCPPPPPYLAFPMTRYPFPLFSSSPDLSRLPLIVFPSCDFSTILALFFRFSSWRDSSPTLFSRFLLTITESEPPPHNLNWSGIFRRLYFPHTSFVGLSCYSFFPCAYLS